MSIPVTDPVARRTPAGRPILEIKDLTVDYGYGETRTHALRGLNITLHAGEVLGIAGESGCGKSTLVYAATRLLPPPGMIAAGQVLYHPKDGSEPYDILRQPEEELRVARWQDTAIVFQGAMNSLNPVYRIGQQITDAITAHTPWRTKKELQARAAELLTMVGIDPGRLRSYPHELSGGMRQRVMIAMALALEPEVLIMDEPTTALDVVMQRQIVEQIVDLRDRLGFSVIFITHDVSLLIEIADRIAIMYAGEIVESGTAEELYRAPRHPYTRGLLTSFPPLHGPRQELRGIPGSPPDLQSLPGGCAFHPRCPFALDRCRVDSPELMPTAWHETGREVACWLNEDPKLMPEELSSPSGASPG